MSNDKRRKIHNIAASIILTPALRPARNDYARLVNGTPVIDSDISQLFARAERAARAAIEATLQGHSEGCPAGAILEACRKAVTEAITTKIPEEGGQLTLSDCRMHTDAETTWAARRLYRENGDAVIEVAQSPDTELDADDRVPAEYWMGIFLDDLSLDELARVAAAVDEGHYTTEEAAARYPDSDRAICVGDKVRWHDPAIADFDAEDRELQKKRRWTVYAVCGDIIKIADEAGEAEVYASELEYLGRRLRERRA